MTLSTSAVIVHGALLAVLFVFGRFLGTDPERDGASHHPSRFIRAARGGWAALVLSIGGGLWVLSAGLCGWTSDAATCQAESTASIVPLAMAYWLFPWLGERAGLRSVQ